MASQTGRTLGGLAGRAGLAAFPLRFGAGVRSSGGGRPVRGFSSAPRRGYPVLGARASRGVRQRHRLLGAVLRRPALAAARLHHRPFDGLRRHWLGPASLVHSGRQIGLLPHFPGHSGGHVLFSPGGVSGRRQRARRFWRAPSGGSWRGSPTSPCPASSQRPCSCLCWP